MVRRLSQISKIRIRKLKEENRRLRNESAKYQRSQKLFEDHMRKESKKRFEKLKRRLKQ